MSYEFDNASREARITAEAWRVQKFVASVYRRNGKDFLAEEMEEKALATRKKAIALRNAFGEMADKLGLSDEVYFPDENY